MKKVEHIKIIGLISIIFGILFFVFALILSISVFGFDNRPPVIVVAILLFLILIMPFVYVISGIGLRNHENWARITLIVFSIINLVNFPIGTAISIYFLIILFDKDVKSLMR